ncbi:MAG: shikimate kinase [Bryobacteraceae bacterium]
MILKLKQTPGLYLAGFMGSGKSTIGRALAARLGWRFVDLDAEIEAREGQSIAAIFDQQGEAAFRVLESEALARLVATVSIGRPLVMAIGGGAFVDPASARRLADRGVTVWLDCPLAVVERRVARATHRPLARDPHALANLYHARRESYARADVRIPIESDDPAVAVEAIVARLGL